MQNNRNISRHKQSLLLITISFVCYLVYNFKFFFSCSKSIPFFIQSYEKPKYFCPHIATLIHSESLRLCQNVHAKNVARFVSAILYLNSPLRMLVQKATWHPCQVQRVFIMLRIRCELLLLSAFSVH